MLCGKDGKPLVHLLKFVKGTALCYGLGFLKVNGCGVFFFFPFNLVAVIFNHWDKNDGEISFSPQDADLASRGDIAVGTRSSIDPPLTSTHGVLGPTSELGGFLVFFLFLSFCVFCF